VSNVVLNTIISSLNAQIEVLLDVSMALEHSQSKEDPDLKDLVLRMDTQMDRFSEEIEAQFVEQLSLGALSKDQIKTVFRLLRKERVLMRRIVQHYQTSMWNLINKHQEALRMLNDLEPQFLKAA